MKNQAKRAVSCDLCGKPLNSEHGQIFPVQETNGNFTIYCRECMQKNDPKWVEECDQYDEKLEQLIEENHKDE